MGEEEEEGQCGTEKEDDDDEAASKRHAHRSSPVLAEKVAVQGDEELGRG